MIGWFALPLAGFIFAVIGHAFLARMAPNASRVVGFFIFAALVGAAMLWLVIAEYGSWSGKTIAAALVYAAACEFYVFVFTLAMASISANVLVRLKQGAMSRDVISSLYNGRTMASRRVERLLSTALAREENGALMLTPRGHRLAQIFIAIRRLFHPENLQVS